MCGLVGVVTKGVNGFTKDQVDAFAQLLYADQLRGKDGTGVFYNSKKGKAIVRSLKAPWRSSDFVKSKEFEEVCEVLFKESNFAIGHNRAATKGKIDVQCTHPFREQHITLVHNGTLYSHKELHDDKEVTVDSHAICHSIAKIGAKETLKKIDGAFALIWFDSKERTLNLCRNSQRPLFIIECKTCFLFVSELELGQWIAKRTDLDIVEHKAVAVEKLYKFNLEDMSKYTEEDVEYKKFVSTVYNYNHGKQPVPTYAGPNRQYAFGTTIRFKSGLVRNQGNGNQYLEGDINKFPQFDPKITRTEDYEDTFRIRYYAKEADLVDLAGGKELSGKICQTVIKRGHTYYVVSDVKPYEHKSTQLAVVEKSKKKCDCCDQEYIGVGSWIEHMMVCPTCKEDLLGGWYGKNGAYC